MKHKYSSCKDFQLADQPIITAEIMLVLGNPYPDMFIRFSGQFFDKQCDGFIVICHRTIVYDSLIISASKDFPPPGFPDLHPLKRKYVFYRTHCKIIFNLDDL